MLPDVEHPLQRTPRQGAVDDDRTHEKVEGRRPELPSSGRDARRPLCGGSSSSGWKVSRSASRATACASAEREEAAVLALLARGSQQRTRKPHASAPIFDQ